MHKKILLFFTLITCIPTQSFAKDYWEQNNCVRGVPERVLVKAKPASVFTLNREDGTAIESLKLDAHTSVNILHSGCEYYGLSYRFMLDDANMKFPVVGDEYRAALRLLEKLKPLTRHNDFALAKEKLETYLNLVVVPKLNEEIYLVNDSIMQRVWVEVEQGQSTVITVTFSTGPL